MLTFNVVREPYGWAIRMGDRMSTPYRSRLSAIRDAHGLAGAIRRQGGCTQVVVEDDEPSRILAGSDHAGRVAWESAHLQAGMGF